MDGALRVVARQHHLHRRILRASSSSPSPGARLLRSNPLFDSVSTATFAARSTSVKEKRSTARLQGTRAPGDRFDTLAAEPPKKAKCWRPPSSPFASRLGTKHLPNEGLRIGTVRRPPRGVPKAEFSSGNWYDVWLPNLAPTAETVKLAQGSRSSREWAAFAKRYRAEMANADNSRVLDLLAALSRTTNFAVGCYCEDESRCHRSILRQLLLDRGAQVL